MSGDMNILGKHLVATVSGGPVLNDMDALLTCMLQACTACGCTVLHSRAHQFEPQGVTVFVMLAESHFSLHTWPERGTACLDIFTCGDVDPVRILSRFANGLALKVDYHSVLARMG